MIDGPPIAVRPGEPITMAEFQPKGSCSSKSLFSSVSLAVLAASWFAFNIASGSEVNITTPYEM